MGADRESTLEGKLSELLEVERFEPPAEFGARALLRDPAIYAEAAADPEGWWLGQARELLDWVEEPNEALDDSEAPHFRWFADGRLNASANCLDRHVEAGNGERVALHWRGEDGEERDVTYAELLADVQRFANAMRERGIGRGDVVGIYLPMIPQVVVAMLAAARIGAVHNVVFGGFSAEAVRERMEFSEAKALVTADGARRKGSTAQVKSKVDAALADVDSIETVFVVGHAGVECPMREGRDVSYEDALEAAAARCAPEPMGAEDPLFILYTSGSTAKPKGILHTTGGYLTGVAWTHRHVFDLRADQDVYWCAADVGWVTGHSYIVYGPLANGATSVMYEGAPDYPGRDVWWEIVERYGVTILYTAPTAIRACMKWGAGYPDRHDLGSLRLLGSVGEPINPKAWLWYHHVIGGGRCPIVDTWWQTETGAIMIAPLPGLTTTKPGSATVPFPGIEAKIYSEGGEEITEGAGILVLTRPWPSMARTLYKEPDRFVEAYWDRFGRDTYLVGDAARKDEDGYLWIVGRIDDVINVSGHRLSTMEVESTLVSNPQVAEAAVIGVPDELTGQAIIAFVILESAGPEGGDGAGPEEELRAYVADKIGKLARPKQIVVCDDLPKTRSGKIMRRILRDIGTGEDDLGDVTTLRDPDVVEDVKERFERAEA